MKILILLVCFSHLFNIAHAQLHLNMDIGYGFDLASRSISDGNVMDLDEHRSEFSLAKHSFGRGINSMISLDYTWNNFVTTGIGGSFLYGTWATKSITNLEGHQRKQQWKGNMLRIIPYIKLQVPLKKITVYSKIGFITGFNGKIYTKYVNTNINPSRINVSEYEHTGGLSFGIMSSLGIAIPISSQLDLTMELKNFSQAYGPRQRELVTSILDGEDRLDNVLHDDRFTFFQNKYISHSNNEDVDMTVFYPFSSIGLNIGFQHNID